MNHGSNGASLDEEYRAVERTFWRDFTKTHNDDQFPSHSQYRLVFDHLVPRLRNFAKRDGVSGTDYAEKLREAERVVDDLALALSSGWRDKKAGWLWFKPTLDCLKFRPDTWDGASPVSTSSLDTATARYLERPWMQLNLLDWYILNGYIFDEAARLADGIKSGSALGTINWAYVFSGGDFEKTIYWCAAFEISKFVARWILIPAIITVFYYVGYHEVATWVAIPYGIYLIIHLSLFPRRYFRRKALTKELKEWQDSLDRLIRIYQSSSSEVFNPSRLRDLIVESESGHTVLKPAVYSILDRAVSRDAAVFAVEGRG